MLRLPLIVGVVLIHNDITAVPMAGGDPGMTHLSISVEFVYDLISDGIARVAVPLFFLISGYLFFVGFKFSGPGYRRKLKARFWTLFVPYVLWNALTLLVYALGESSHYTRKFFATRAWPPVASFHLRDYLDALFGIFTLHPIAYQFWFVRDLMALVLLVPIVNLFIHRKAIGVPVLLILFACWFMDIWPVIWPSAVATLFFCGGAYLAASKLNLSSDRFEPLLSVLFLLVLISDALMTCFQSPAQPYVHRLMILLGIPSIWWVTGYIGRHAAKVKSALIALSGSSFFVYAAHEPLLTISRKLAFKLATPRNDFLILFLYLCVPIALTTLLIWVYRWLNISIPSVLALMTGKGDIRQPAPAAIAAE